MLMINEIYVLFTWDLILDDLVEQIFSVILCSVMWYLFLFGVGIILNLIKNKNYGNIDRVLFIYYLLIFNVYVQIYSIMLCRLNLRKKICLCLDFFILNLVIYKFVFILK